MLYVGQNRARQILLCGLDYDTEPRQLHSADQSYSAVPFKTEIIGGGIVACKIAICDVRRTLKTESKQKVSGGSKREMDRCFGQKIRWE